MSHYSPTAELKRLRHVLAGIITTELGPVGSGRGSTVIGPMRDLLRVLDDELAETAHAVGDRYTVTLGAPDTPAICSVTNASLDTALECVTSWGVLYRDIPWRVQPHGRGFRAGELERFRAAWRGDGF